MTQNTDFNIPTDPKQLKGWDFDSAILDLLETLKTKLGDDYHSFDTYFSGYLECLEDHADIREQTEKVQMESAIAVCTYALAGWNRQYKKF